MDDRSLAPDGSLLARLQTGLGGAVWRRILNGTLANLVDKLAVLAMQLLAIPLLSHHWGAEGYGTWLMLMTVPTYIAVSDFGLGAAAGVEITRHAARGDTKAALRVFQSAWVFVFAILAVVGVTMALYAALVTSGTLGGSPELAVSVLLVTLYAIAAVQMTTLAIVYRATHKFALAMSISAAVIAAEAVTMAVVVLVGGQLVAVLSALLIVRIIGWAVTWLVLRRLEPWARLGIDSASLTTLRSLMRPSLAAFSMMLASSISLQGMVLAIGFVAGPVAAGILGAARFLSRIPLQFSGLVMRASLPEMTRAQLSADNELHRRLDRINTASALIPTLPFVLLLPLFGPQLLAGMSGDALAADWWLFGLLAMTTAVGALWQAMASPLIAANRQARFAYGYAVVSAGAVAAVFLPGTPALAVAAGAPLLAELAMVALIHKVKSPPYDR